MQKSQQRSSEKLVFLSHRVRKLTESAAGNAYLLENSERLSLHVHAHEQLVLLVGIVVLRSRRYSI
jgi:hypothetical protein